MGFVQALEDFGVEVAFAEANAWHACPTNHENKKEKDQMSKPSSRKKTRARNRAILFGLMSVALYAAVFANSSTIMTYFTKGHFYTVLPVATVFVFSYVHGSFASNLWTALGVEASKKATARKEDTKTKRPETQPRARVHAG